MVYAIDISNPQVNPAAKFGTLGSILSIILPIITIGSALIVLFLFMYGAYNLLTGGGSPDAIKKTQATFTYAIMGLVVIIFSVFIVRFLGTILNITLPF